MGKEFKRTQAVKYDWYQNDLNVVVTIMVKNLSNKTALITFAPEDLFVKLVSPKGGLYKHTIKLMHDIIPEISTVRLTPSKVEATLKKVKRMSWTCLEKSHAIAQNLLQVSRGKLTFHLPIHTEIAAAPVTYPTCKPGKDRKALEFKVRRGDCTDKNAGEGNVPLLFAKNYITNKNVGRTMEKNFQGTDVVPDTNWRIPESSGLADVLRREAEPKKWAF